MRKTALAALAAAMLAAPPGTAHATVSTSGFVCSRPMTTYHPTQSGWELAEVDAMLVLHDLDRPTRVLSASVTCTVQHDLTHAGADLGYHEGLTTTGVAVAAGSIAYPRDPAREVYLCTQLNVTGGPRLYWDGVRAEWSTSPGVVCEQFVELDPLEAVNEVLTEWVDPVVCPVLADVLPPEGDIDGVWDCPPYDA